MDEGEGVKKIIKIKKRSGHYRYNDKKKIRSVRGWRRQEQRKGKERPE